MDKSAIDSEEILKIGRRLTEQSAVVGSDGNLSVRTAKDRLLITPAGYPLGNLAEQDLVGTDLDGRVVSGNQKPSSEIGMHLAIYRARPDVRGIVHAHPPFATALAVAGLELDSAILPELIVAVGQVPLIAYATPGTPAVAEAMADDLAENDAFILRNHGLVTLGTTLEQAFRRYETVEHGARVTYLARQLGEPERIPKADVELLMNLREQMKETSKRSSRD